MIREAQPGKPRPRYGTPVAGLVPQAFEAVTTCTELRHVEQKARGPKLTPKPEMQAVKTSAGDT